METQGLECRRFLPASSQVHDRWRRARLPNWTVRDTGELEVTAPDGAGAGVTGGDRVFEVVQANIRERLSLEPKGCDEEEGWSRDGPGVGRTSTPSLGHSSSQAAR